MKREFSINDIDFRISNYTARKNDFEKGLKYQLFHKAYFDFFGRSGKMDTDLKA